MKNKPILIVHGEPNSVFLEIFFKSIKKINCPIILISSFKIIKLYMKRYKIKKKINLIEYELINKTKFKNRSINVINVDLNQKKLFEKISDKSNIFIDSSFNLALSIIDKKITNKLINGPISKKNFLKKKFAGVTEYLSKKTNTKKVAMLIYNNSLSVCPLTTHLPIKKVVKHITKKNIKEKVYLINNFYKKFRKIKPRIAITGLNPHCESTDKFNEDEKIIKPTVNYLKKHGFNVNGPLSADTIFLKKNRERFDVILGMYHDQVLTPMKTLYEYNAINITLGLPFIRVSPDHGPNEKMLKKNLSNPSSLIESIKFLDKN